MIGYLYIWAYAYMESMNGQHLSSGWERSSSIQNMRLGSFAAQICDMRVADSDLLLLCVIFD